MTTSLDRALDAAMERLMKLAEAQQKKRAELDKWLATQPAYTVCEKHNQRLDIDPDESSRISQDLGRNAVAYEMCPDCVAAFKRSLRNEKFSELGIPFKYCGATLDDLQYATPQGKVNLEHCRQYAKAPKGFLVLLGDKGNGKTHIGAAILQQFGRGTFITQSTLLSMHRETYNNSLAMDIRQKCMNTALLVLDEAGVSVGGKDEGPLVYDILNERYANKRPTIITANLTLAQLGTALGERIMDRLKEAAYKILTFNEPSKRPAANIVYLQQ